MNTLMRREFDFPLLRDDFFSPFQQVFNEFYDDFFNKERTIKLQTSGFPKMDIGTENGKYFIKAAVSGFTPEDIKVEITPENTVRISGQMSEKYKTSDKAKCFVKQFCQRQFVKEFSLPDGLVCGEDSKTVAAPTATLTDGVLMLTWDIAPTIEQKPKTRMIPINKE